MVAASEVVETATKVTTSSSEILQGYLIKALDKTGNLVDKAVDMVTEQAPLLIQEVLKWYFAYNLILFILGIVVIIGTIYGVRKLVKYVDADGAEYLLVAGILAFVGTISSSLINLQWLKIWIAPRLWLIEYTTNLVKNGTGH